MIKIFPFIFIILWSSAFITTKPLIDNSDPFSALAFRFGIVAFGFFIFSIISKNKILIKRKFFLESFFSGALFHGLYLGGVFFAVSKGMPTAIAALIVTLQPILTNALIGFIATVISLIAITTSTIWQKKLSNNLPLPVSNFYQAVGGFSFHLLIIIIFVDPYINFTKTFIFAMSHQIFLVSFGAFTILMYLIKKNSASKTVSIFFLIPPTSAFMAWVFLNEKLNTLDLIGFVVASIGVFIATRNKN